MVVPLALLIGGLDAILIAGYAFGRSQASLLLAAIVTLGFPWLLLAVPRHWKGAWSLDMTIQGPDSRFEGPLLWQAVCEGLRSLGAQLEEQRPPDASGKAGRSEATAYVPRHRTRIRLVNQLTEDRTGQPTLFTSLILEPAVRGTDSQPLRSSLSEILSHERARYRRIAAEKGYVILPDSESPAGKT